MAALVGTNILVYRYDARFPEKQRIATKLLRDGIINDSIRITRRALIEFVAATTRSPGRSDKAILSTYESCSIGIPMS